MSRIPFFQNEDLDIFFNEFAEDCLLLDNVNNIIIPCLYNENFGFINSLNQDINGVTITLNLKNSDIENYLIKKRTNLKVRNLNFKVREVRKNGDGISEVELEKVE